MALIWLTGNINHIISNNCQKEFSTMPCDFILIDFFFTFSFCDFCFFWHMFIKCRKKVVLQIIFSVFILFKLVG